MYREKKAISHKIYWDVFTVIKKGHEHSFIYLAVET